MYHKLVQPYRGKRNPPLLDITLLKKHMSKVKIKKRVKKIIWILMILFIGIGLFASINQIPPKETINRFDEHPVQTLLHVVPAILFLIIGPIQFMPSVRRKHPKVHRILGWIFAVISLSIGITALTIVFNFPYGGIAEQIPITVFAILFLFFLIRGIKRAIHRKINLHRKDLLRVYSLGLGASLFRILIVPLAIMGYDPKILVPFIFWLSFGGMLGICELYLWSFSKKNVSLKKYIHD